MLKGKCNKVKKGILISAFAIVAVAAVVAGINYLSVQHLLKMGDSYDKVEIKNQLVPEKDEKGNWCFTTDDHLQA